MDLVGRILSSRQPISFSIVMVETSLVGTFVAIASAWMFDEEKDVVGPRLREINPCSQRGSGGVTGPTPLLNHVYLGPIGEVIRVLRSA